MSEEMFNDVMDVGAEEDVVVVAWAESRAAMFVYIATPIALLLIAYGGVAH